MARMIDPSELDGEELFNWYRRSPDEVEAERAGARQDAYDAFVRSIRASPSQDDDPSGPRARSDDAWQRSSSSGSRESGANPQIIEAKFFRPMAPVTIPPPPSGPNVGPPLDTWGGPPSEVAKSGFFGTHGYSDALGGYYTDLPSPLNTVRSNGTHWWELGDGSLAQAGEVERIYAEQQRRLSGRDDVAPAARVRAVDNWKDGQVPQASQVAKGERERDPTCHPNGGWERDPQFDSYSRRTQRYEAQITHAPGLDYVVRNPGHAPVRFDGCAVWEPEHHLLEAKGPGYAQLIPYGFQKMFDSAKDQAGRQADAAPGQEIEWHIAEPGALPFFTTATGLRRPPITLHQTPAR
jgi:Restriction endonuclease fold toxin 5